MSIYIKKDNENVDWKAVSELLRFFGLCDYDADTEQKIFENSYAVAFVYEDDRLIGCGRALSDGICQAAIYNVALRDEYQGQQLGRAIINALLEQVKGCTAVLYTHPKTVALYERLGFRRQKTGMVMFGGDDESIKWLEEEGFLLPKAYRFGDNSYEKTDRS